MVAWQHGSMAAWQQACQTSCKMHCYAMSLLHPAGPRTASLRENPKYGANRLFHTSARLFARFARRARSVFHFCCIQLASCWARPVLRRLFSPGDINILRVAQMFSHVIGSNVTSHWEVSFMFVFFSKQTWGLTIFLKRVSLLVGSLKFFLPQM